jgi:uncharacterized protein YdiU (UPF0061 family)
MQPFKKLMDAHYHTATVDHLTIPGTDVVRSSSLRQVMRFAARFNNEAPEAEIKVFRHMNGHDPKLVARRLVTQRFWHYTGESNDHEMLQDTVQSGLCPFVQTKRLTISVSQKVE